MSGPAKVITGTWADAAREALEIWDRACEADSNDAEYDAGLGLAEGLRGLLELHHGPSVSKLLATDVPSLDAADAFWLLLEVKRELAGKVPAGQKGEQSC